MLKEFTHGGREFTVEVEVDYCGDTPWEWADGHGPVSDWVVRDKRPGEWVLNQDRGHKRFYDFKEAMKMAKRDGWGAEPYSVGTKGERALRAVEADFKYLKDWCDDKWYYATLTVRMVGTEHEDNLGMVEYDYSDEGYWMDAAHEMASNLVYAEAREKADMAWARVVSVAMSEGARV